MKIKFLGGSTFVIKTGDTTVVLDPTSDSNIKMKKTEADICVTTDPKYSDCDSIVQANPNKELFIIGGQGEYEIGGVFVEVIAYHGKAVDLDKDLIVKLRAEDITILYLGYMNRPLTKKEIESYSNVNVLIAPVGNKSFITYDDLDTVINSSDPAILIPSVYAEGKIHSGIKEIESVDEFLKHMGTKEAEHEKVLNIKSADFGSEEEMPLRIVVLEKE